MLLKKFESKISFVTKKIQITYGRLKSEKIYFTFANLPVFEKKLRINLYITISSHVICLHVKDL